MKKRLAALAVLICTLVCLIVSVCTAPGDIGGSAIRILFLDVGQGDCILIRTAEGDILIDSGPERAQNELCMKLADLGVVSLRLAVLTHPDEDHIGGADGVLRQIPTREIWMSQEERNDAGESEMLLWRAARESGAEIRTVRDGEIWQLGGVTLYVLAPSEIDEDDPNASSIVLKMTYGNVSALFTGDADSSVERHLVQRYGVHLDCDLYKVGHHGSSTSSDTALIAAVSPAWAVISCAAGNEYGHPHGETLTTLEAAGAVVYRTDLCGDVVFDCDGERLIPME